MGLLNVETQCKVWEEFDFEKPQQHDICAGHQKFNMNIHELCSPFYKVPHIQYQVHSLHKESMKLKTLTGRRINRLPFFFRLTTRNGPPWCVCVPVKLPDAWVSLQIHEPLNYPKCHFSLARTKVRWHDLLIQFGSFWWVDNPWLTLCGSNMYKRQLSWPRCQVTGTPLALTLGQTMEILVDYHDGDPGDPPKNSIRWYYCGWKKSCTSWQVVCSIIYRVLTIQGGAGFLPSTVVTKTSS